MTILVTGASGHVGGNLVRALLARGDDVRVLVRGDTAAVEGLPLQQVRGDVNDRDSLERAMAGIDTVFHLAATISILGDRGGQVARVNVEGAGMVASAARHAGVRRFVHMSSCHAFDLDHRPGAIDEHAPRPKPSDPFYNRSKAMGEHAVRSALAGSVSHVIVNPTGVIGPLDFKPSRMGRFFLALARGHIPALIEGGFDFVDVRDLVATTLRAAAVGRDGENYLVGGHYATVGQVTATAAASSGRRSPRVTVPMWLARVGAPFMDGYGRTTGREPLYTGESLHALRAGRIDSGRAIAELDHEARPLAETVADVYADFRARGVLPRA
ncbi:MAG: NAD-dependent epimerase/dehydratase family protein [Nannocystaceae bacterium]|nr:NAD-dependent epimerase/dehydratase family protein [Nannocystaceae bacterium]